MPRRWAPSRVWQGEDCCVVGGGPSLKTFDWELVRGEHVVGCNSAFSLGAGIVEVLLFADYEWWCRIGQEQLPQYGGLVVGCSPRLEEDWNKLPDWLNLAKRGSDHIGLLDDGRLAFNGNTGAMAINLALSMGARHVYLLGFDMRLDPSTGEANWHKLRYEPGRAEVYPVFKRSMDFVARDVPKKFPGSAVVNVSDVSELRAFPRVSLAEHFGAAAKREEVVDGRGEEHEDEGGGGGGRGLGHAGGPRPAGLHEPAHPRC